MAAHADMLLAALALGLVAGWPLAWCLGVVRATRFLHRLVGRLGEKLNRPDRPIATRASRGFIVPCLLIALATMAGYALLLALHALPHYRPLAGVVLLAALLSPQRYLWPLWQATRRAAQHQWIALDGPVRQLAGGSASAVDGHGACRMLLQLSGPLFVYHGFGSALAFLLGSFPALFAYRMLFTCAAHFDGRIGIWRGFHWASTQLARLFALPALLAALPILVLCGQFLPRVRPLRGLWGAVRHGSGNFIDRFAAYSLGIALGGPMQLYGHQLQAPWVGVGSAQLSAAHVLQWAFWLLMASIAAVLLLATALQYIAQGIVI